MLHHVELYVSDLARTQNFWSEILSIIGYSVTDQWDDGFTLSDGKDAYLTFVQVNARHAHRPYHRCGVGLNHLAFKVDDRETVDRLRKHCQEKAFTCLYDDQYPFANGSDDYYALFVEDPERIKVEFVAITASS